MSKSQSYTREVSSAGNKKMIGMVRDNPASWKLRAAKRQLAAKLAVESSQNLGTSEKG